MSGAAAQGLDARQAAPAWYVGLMSGTSLDGVDGVLVNFCQSGQPLVLAHASQPFEPAFKAELLALNSPSHNELHRSALAANALARVYADVVQSLLTQAGMAASAVTAIGAHGQTVRHQPGAFDGVGYTLQLNSPALLAELTGIQVACDFRSRDLAAGGQGAPLVPAFHRMWLAQADSDVAVLNLGGIANLSLLQANGDTRGFDCGPGNGLLDFWCEQQLQQPFDAGGAWAASGQVHDGLLAALLQEPFFALPPPKSTGRDLFNASWLQARLAAYPDLAPADVQATLAQLTASSAAQAVLRHAPQSERLIVCGGGAFNRDLLQRLQQQLASITVATSETYGLPPLQVEATAFAWLAQQLVNSRSTELSAVTGACGDRVLGALYPA